MNYNTLYFKFITCIVLPGISNGNAVVWKASSATIAACHVKMAQK